MPAIAHQNKILGNTSGGGSTILVTTSESSLYGQTVSLTDGTTTLNTTFNNSGEATFSDVTMTGTLTVSASYGGQTAQRTISVPYFGNYSTSLSFFTATITVTFDASKGATCTLDGVTASTSPYAFTVSSAGTYTASSTLDGVTKQGTAKTITTDGQTETDTIEFGTINVTYDNDFRGASITCTQGGTTITKTAPSGGNTMAFYPPTTGSWTISGTVGGSPYSTSVTVSSLSTAVPANLETIPDGSTKTPTDDIQIWLACAGITDKAYTTLAEVLADMDTYVTLLGDSNACDYMARSTTWASTIVADADAMRLLGMYDYACYVLRANNTWNTAINNSSYASYIPASPTGQTDIIHSAPSDTIYYMDNGSPVTLCTTDASGVGSVDWSDLPTGDITLYSSVAKNPTDLTADYSKSIKVTKNKVEAWLMPDTALYWYGYLPYAFSGYAIKPSGSTSSWTAAAPTITEYTNYMSVRNTTNGTAGTASNGRLVNLSNYNTFNTIAKANANAEYGASSRLISSLSNNYSSVISLGYTHDDNTWTLKSGDISASTDNVYIAIFTHYYNNKQGDLEIEALWLE